MLIFGLALSVALMGIAASFIARLLTEYRWIAWIGLLVILYVAAAHDLGGLARRPRRRARDAAGRHRGPGSLIDPEGTMAPAAAAH